MQRDDVSLIDVTLQIEAARVKVGDAPYAMSQDAKRGLLFVTNQQDGSVSVLSLASAKEIKRIPVGDYPEGIDYSSVLDRFYVASWSAGLYGPPGRPGADAARQPYALPRRVRAEPSAT